MPRPTICLPVNFVGVFPLVAEILLGIVLVTTLQCLAQFVQHTFQLLAGRPKSNQS